MIADVVVLVVLVVLVAMVGIVGMVGTTATTVLTQTATAVAVANEVAVAVADSGGFHRFLPLRCARRLVCGVIKDTARNIEGGEGGG